MMLLRAFGVCPFSVHHPYRANLDIVWELIATMDENKSRSGNDNIDKRGER